MAVVTLFGAVGAFVIEPFIGVAVYYMFAVLRPQYLWEWALPAGVGWSAYVAYSTIFATIWWMLAANANAPTARPRFAAAHKAFLVFGAWICLTYVTAQNTEVAWPWFLEYLKLFVMFAIAARVLTNLNQVWWIYRVATVVLIYIA